MLTEGYFRYVCKYCGESYLIKADEIVSFAKEQGNPISRDIGKMLKGFKISINCPKKSNTRTNFKSLFKTEYKYSFKEIQFYLGEWGDDIINDTVHLG